MIFILDCYEWNDGNDEPSFCDVKNAHSTCVQIAAKLNEPIVNYVLSQNCKEAKVHLGPQNVHLCKVLPCTEYNDVVLFYVTIDTKHEKVHVLLLKEFSIRASGELLELKYLNSIPYDLKYDNYAYLQQRNVEDGNPSDEYYPHSNY